VEVFPRAVPSQTPLADNSWVLVGWVRAERLAARVLAGTKVPAVRHLVALKVPVVPKDLRYRLSPIIQKRGRLRR
jgi:hypothetical protein